MLRSWVVVFLAGMLASNAFLSNAALAQCRGGGGSGGGQGGSMGMTGTTGVTSCAGLLGLGGTGVSTYTGPGSLAYGMMMSQIIAQQMAQQQAMLAMRQQQLKAEQLAARKYRAEQSRSAVAASRARTRALLAVQSGLPAANKPPATLVAYNSVRR
ncbi:MAG TPA: hypothetical protein VGI40_08410 [Pirellulaceae bacterium]